MKEVVYKPFVIVYSPFKMVQDVPMQSAVARWIIRSVEVFQEYVGCLKDLRVFRV